MLLKLEVDRIDSIGIWSVSVLHSEKWLLSQGGEWLPEDSSVAEKSEKWLPRFSASSAFSLASRSSKASSITDEGVFGSVGSLLSLKVNGVGVVESPWTAISCAMARSEGTSFC